MDNLKMTKAEAYERAKRYAADLGATMYKIDNEVRVCGVLRVCGDPAFRQWEIVIDTCDRASATLATFAYREEGEK